ncbi:MAG TPA: antitoxin Xre/MbcA/ParS toxin-binding domain-containing protein [Ignavibacteria bacterium]|nr:antitoxin Xre/MbcA/ParS toxin-binding domain-containing protein [Ignavibacteria bacterium]
MSYIIRKIDAIKKFYKMDKYSLYNKANKGLKYNEFEDFVRENVIPYNKVSNLLELSERTLQRYKKEHKTFSALHSQRILELKQLDEKGKEVFGSKEKFRHWLMTQNSFLKNKKPIDLLTNSFGVDILMDELSRIEHGIFA